MRVWDMAYILEKNKLFTDKPWIALLKIEHPSLPTPIYLARNNEDVTWNGQTWTRFPIEFGNITQAGKEQPTITLKISNLGGLVESYIQNYNGFTDAILTLYVVHANLLSITDPAYEVEFKCDFTRYEPQWVSFELTCEHDLNYRFPPDTYMKDFCPFKFKSVRCGYAGSAAECNGTLASCRIPSRFGGEPGVESGS